MDTNLIIAILLLVMGFCFFVIFFLQKKISHYFIYIMFGIGIGALFEVLEIILVIFGLRIEAWIWLFILVSLFIGLLGIYRLNKGVQILITSNFRFYLIYLLILFINILRTENIGEGAGLFLISLFPIVAVIHFYSNNLGKKDFIMLLRLALLSNLIFLVIFILTGQDIFRRDYTGTLRLTGSMGWSSLSYFLLVILVYLLVLFRESGKKQYLFFISFCILLIVATITRTSIIALVFIIMGTVFTMNRGRNVIILISLLLSISLVPIFYELFYTRFFYNSSSIGIATSGRATSLEFLFDKFMWNLESLIFGVGTGMARSSLGELEYLGIRRIHSTFGEAFFDTGIIGVFFLFLFSVIGLSRSYRRLLLFRPDLTYRSNLYKSEISSIYFAYCGYIILFFILMFDNIYDPFLVAVIFQMILLGEVTIIKKQTQPKTDKF